MVDAKHGKSELGGRYGYARRGNQKLAPDVKCDVATLNKPDVAKGAL